MTAAALATTNAPDATALDDAPAVPAEFVKLAVALRAGVFTGKAPQRTAQRWAMGLPAGQSVCQGKHRYVHRNALGPDGKSIREAIERLLAPKPLALQAAPPSVEEFGTDDKSRWADTLKLLHEWRAIHCDERKSIKEAAAILERRRGAWANERGLSCKFTTLLRYQKRVRADGNRDMRGRTRERPDEPAASPEAWELFRSIYLHGNKHDAAATWRFVRAKARAEGWTWPSLRTVQLMARDIPEAVKVLTREGPRAFEAKCVPKLDRGIEHILAREWYCLDGRRLDIRCKVPDSRCEWREEHPVVMGCLDLRSRRMVLDVRLTECADGAIASLALAIRQWGVCGDLIADNGEGYKAAFGSRRGSERQKAMIEDPRFGAMTTQLGVKLHPTLPYSAWSKPIESHWNHVKNGFDRWFHLAFQGGSPAERAEGREKEIKANTDELPTLEEVRSQLAIWLEEYDNAPQTGAGMRGMSPREVMERYSAEERRVADELLDFLSQRRIGPKRRRPNGGFRHEHAEYGKWQPDILGLPADRDYHLWVDPARLDRVTVETPDGELIRAYDERLSGVNAEHRKKAHKIKATYRKAVRAQAEVRDFIDQTPTRQLLEVKRDEAVAQAKARARTLPEAPTTTVTLVLPERAAAVKELARGEQRQEAAASIPAARSAFDLLSRPSRKPVEQPAADELSQVDWLAKFSSGRRVNHAG